MRSRYSGHSKAARFLIALQHGPRGGAHALALDVALATNNEREFKRIAGLSVKDWTK